MTWRLPWVSRAYHDGMMQQATSFAAMLDRTATLAQNEARQERETSSEWRKLYVDLLARYHSLKQQGYAEPPAPVVREPKPIDVVKSAIAKKAGRSRALREQMEAQAVQDRADGKSEDEIARSILTGVSGEEIMLA